MVTRAKVCARHVLSTSPWKGTNREASAGARREEQRPELKVPIRDNAGARFDDLPIRAAAWRQMRGVSIRIRIY